MKRLNEKLLASKQKGAALIVLVFMVALLLTTFYLKAYDPTTLKAEQDKKTNLALSQAKQALLAYSANKIPVSINKGIPNPVTDCNSNCQRPGDLPCPDRNNDGVAENNCSSQANRLGRLPWKTLGIGELRDGAGERLWYAVSNQYKNNPRILPLNSDSLGTISSRNSLGDLSYDATLGSGLVAIVIAPKAVLTREDNLVQNRTVANENVANNYLDIAFGEDNADFVDGTSNGFISGKILVGGREILNDIALPITKNEMNAAIEQRVLSEVMRAILIGFCPGRSDIKTRTCGGIKVNDFLPDPASVTDVSCLGQNDIADIDCVGDNSLSFGRIPVGGVVGVTGGSGWEASDLNSILQGQSKNNWFQQNGWRELIFYARAPACAETMKNCTGTGYLTLQNALTSPANNKQVVLVSAGSVLLGQVRLNNIDKTAFANYLEDENFLPLDDVFSRYTLNANKNDRTTSIP